MDKIRMIALSKIADILSSSNLINPKVDIWKKIFNNAGLFDEYEEKSFEFETKVERYGCRDDEKIFRHNDRCYNALNEIFNELEINSEDFLKLFNSIANKISLTNVFIEDIEECIPRNKFKYMSINEYLDTLDIYEKNKLLKDYSNKEFNLLRNNLNIIELDICFNGEGLTIKPFIKHAKEVEFDDNILLQWLERYPNIHRRYLDAIKAYSRGDSAGCIVHCRNIIEGIFSYKKDEQRKWLDGLAKACHMDKNIDKAKVTDILKYRYNANSNDINERYQYPRFNLIYKLYAFECALGGHIDSGNKIENRVDHEEVIQADAFMSLRMTEDVLVWLYQTNSLDFQVDLKS